MTAASVLATAGIVAFALWVGALVTGQLTIGLAAANFLTAVCLLLYLELGRDGP